MTRKILCLHGKGTSGAIFKSQTSSIRAHLKDLDVDFHFIDAPYRSTPAAGIDLFYPGPYYSFWESEDASHIAHTRAWLNQLIAKSGPYDAVMAFSQGCSVSADMLLHHQAESPNSPPPFKSAIFICGGPLLTELERLGYTISLDAWERDHASRKALAEQADVSAILSKGSARWGAGLDSAALPSFDELTSEITGPYQIQVPTAHVYGAKDPRYFSGVQLAGLGEPSKRKVFDHGGGHEIPRTDVVSRTIADMVRWALDQGGRC
ncbi:hypothetical protein DTO045G8_7 [Paecilomyces variotii]|nr:hypothetical protein DTO045G8_7 [Paecilomyces variotii]